MYIYMFTQWATKKKQKNGSQSEPALFIQFKLPGLRTSSFANDPSVDCNSVEKNKKQNRIVCKQPAFYENFCSN